MCNSTYNLTLAFRVHTDWVIHHHRSRCCRIDICCRPRSMENLNPCGSRHEVAGVPRSLKGSPPHWQALDAAQINVTPVRAEFLTSWVGELYYDIIAS